MFFLPGRGIERKSQMITLYYDTMLFSSIVLTVIYFIIWHKHFSVHITLLFTLIPFADLGYVLLANSQNAQSAEDAMKLTYLGGCFLDLLITFSIFQLCKIKVSKLIQSVLMLSSFLIYSCALMIGRNGLIYKSTEFYS